MRRSRSTRDLIIYDRCRGNRDVDLTKSALPGLCFLYLIEVIDRIFQTRIPKFRVTLAFWIEQ